MKYNDDESTKADNRPSLQWYPDDWLAEVSIKLCSMAAQGLWFNMLNMMFKAKPRGILPLIGNSKSMAKDGKTLLLYSKQLAKILGQDEDDVSKWLQELIGNQVCSIDANGCIYCRRMYREWQKKKDIHNKRMKAGKRGADKRWKPNSKDIAKIAASTPSSTPSSKNPRAGGNHDEKLDNRRMTKTPTKQLFAIFQEEWLNYRGGKYEFITGKDGMCAKRLWMQCQKECPNDPIEHYTKKLKAIFEAIPNLQCYGGIETFWNAPTAKKPDKGEEIIALAVDDLGKSSSEEKILKWLKQLPERLHSTLCQKLNRMYPGGHSYSKAKDRYARGIIEKKRT